MVTIDHLSRGLQLASMTIQGLATGEVTRHQGDPCKSSVTVVHHLESLFIIFFQSLITTVHGEIYACWDGIEDITCYFDVNLKQSKKDMSPCLYILFHHFS